MSRLVCGYVRVSTTEQAEGGASLEAQRQQIRAWAAQHGHTLTSIVTEAGVSGGIPFGERPAASKLLEQVSRGDVIVGSKLDRLFRSASDCLVTAEAMQKRGVHLYLLDLNGGADSVSGNGISKLFLSLLSAVAEFERDRIAERIREGKKQKAAQGFYGGGKREFGYRIEDDRLIEDPEEQRAIRRMQRLAGRGWSLRRIAEAIREEGIPISHGGVARILERTEKAKAA